MKELLDSIRLNIDDKVKEADGWSKALWTFLLGLFDGLYAGAVVIGFIVIIMGGVLLLIPNKNNEEEE